MTKNHKSRRAFEITADDEIAIGISDPSIKTNIAAAKHALNRAAVSFSQADRLIAQALWIQDKLSARSASAIEHGTRTEAVILPLFPQAKP